MLRFDSSFYELAYSVYDKNSFKDLVLLHFRSFFGLYKINYISDEYPRKIKARKIKSDKFYSYEFSKKGKRMCFFYKGEYKKEAIAMILFLFPYHYHRHVSLYDTDDF